MKSKAMANTNFSAVNIQLANEMLAQVLLGETPSAVGPNARQVIRIARSIFGWLMGAKSGDAFADLLTRIQNGLPILSNEDVYETRPAQRLEHDLFPGEIIHVSHQYLGYGTDAIVVATHNDGADVVVAPLELMNLYLRFQKPEYPTRESEVFAGQLFQLELPPDYAI
jgi:hypothetical protein